MYEIVGKVALITGGTSGIGLSIAKALLENGAKGVSVICTNEEKGKLAIESIIKEYGDDKVLLIKADVSIRNQYDDAFKTTISKFKNLDIVINNAGICEEKNLERTIAVNLGGTAIGTVLAIEKYLPKYKTGEDAVVLNMSSVFGFGDKCGAPIYNATKGGIITLTKSFGSEIHYERTKIRVMVICPGVTSTPILQTNELTFLNDEIYGKIVFEDFARNQLQDVSYVSKAVIHMIKEGKTGSVWVSEDEQPPYEVNVLYQKN